MQDISKTYHSTSTPAHMFVDAQDIINYILGGRAVITIKSLKTGNHHTFRVRKKTYVDKLGNNPKVYFYVWARGDSWYTYIGAIHKNKFMHTKKSSTAPNMSIKFTAFNTVWYLINKSVMHTMIEVWHHGTCGICGRYLTHPESIKRGIGPICAQYGH